MSLNRAALMIREAQKPKRIRLYNWHGLWMVRSEWTKKTTYCADFQDAVAMMEAELLERIAML